MWERADYFIKTGKRDLRGYGGSGHSSIGATSSSTSQYKSLDTKTILLTNNSGSSFNISLLHKTSI